MRNVLLVSLLVLATAGCRFKGDPKTDAAPASCAPVSFTCGDHADCCSYACVGGACIPNVVAGGVCRTSDDCDASMTCVGGECTPGNDPRVEGDTCTANSMCRSGNCDGENNTVYPPIAGTCRINNAPVVANVGPVIQPYFATTTLSALASDADAGDTLYYVWRLTQAPAGHGLGTSWSASGAHPTVFLQAAGTYVFGVTVTDGILNTQRGRLSASGTVTIDARNLPPVVSAGDDVPSLLRNTSMVVSGTVMDPNGAATAVTCAWYAKPPSGGAETMLGTPRSPCYAATHSATFAPNIDAEQGPWSLRLEAFDGQYLTSDVRVVNVTNAPPVPNACQGCAAAPYARVVNLGPDPDPQVAISVIGSATDLNGDVGTPGFEWTWTVTEKDGVALVDPLVLGTGDGTSPPFLASFEPVAAGTYAAVLSVRDGHGGTADATVVVRVEPYLRPLHPVDLGTGLPFGGTIADAVYVHATDRIAYVGASDWSTAHHLWLLDPEASATSAIASTDLDAQPIAMAVDPDGASGVVGEVGRFEKISFSGGPNSTGSWPLAFTPLQVLDAGQKEYALGGASRIYDVGSSSVSEAQCGTQTPCGSIVTRGVAGSNTVWLLDEATDIMRRYSVKNGNGDLELTYSVTVPATPPSSHVWLSAVYGLAQDVIVSGGARYAAGTLAPAIPALPYAARHLDTTAVSGELRGVVTNALGDEVRRVAAGWTAPAENALRLPAVGYRGTGYPATARYAFVRTDGTAYYVVLRAVIAGDERWYLAKYPDPNVP